MLRGGGIRVQTIVIANQEWGETPADVAIQYGQPEGLVKEALKFYEAHQAEIDLLIQADSMLEASRDG